VTSSVSYYRQMFKCQSRRDDGKVSASGFVLVVLVFAALMVMTFAGSIMSQNKNISEKNASSDVSVISLSQVW
jgi:hypothetical protein